MWQCEVVIDDRKKKSGRCEIARTQFTIRIYFFVVRFRFSVFFSSSYTNYDAYVKIQKFNDIAWSVAVHTQSHIVQQYTNARALSQQSHCTGTHMHTHVNALSCSSRSSLARIAAPMTTTTSKYQKIIPRVFVFIIRKIHARSQRPTHKYLRHTVPCKRVSERARRATERNSEPFLLGARERCGNAHKRWQRQRQPTEQR